MDINYSGTLADGESHMRNRSPETERRGASRSAERNGLGMGQRIAGLDWHSSSILHDLRNPVATIYAGTELLMTSLVGPAEMKRLAANMHSAAARMRKLLTEISCAMHGDKSAIEICAISEVIAAASEAVSASTDRPSVRISLDVPRGIALPMTRSRIERVFFNLIINSFEAMPGGGEVRIRAMQAGGYAVVELEDTGPGIPNEIRGRVCQGSVTAGKADGLGLGLYLSRQTMLDHGGDLWTEPAPGARFVMRFPLTRVQER